MRMIVLLVLCFLVLEGALGETSSLHGGTFIAFAGEKCVVLASDSRFSSPSSGPLLIGQFPRAIYRVGKTLIGGYGLDSDTAALMDSIRVKLAEFREDDIEPVTVATVVSDLLYDNRFICSPIVVGLSKANQPFLCSMDGLGAQTVTSDFCVTGTASDGLYAICESLYQPNLTAHQLVTLTEQCLEEALQRDVMSGCKVHILTLLPDAVHLKVFESADV